MATHTFHRALPMAALAGVLLSGLAGCMGYPSEAPYGGPGSDPGGEGIEGPGEGAGAGVDSAGEVPSPGARPDERLAPEPPASTPPDPTRPVVPINPFVVAEHDPFSTFAADVDTASYDIMRREVLDYRALPDPRTVRLEEHVNAFDYRDPAPSADSDVPFQVSLQLAPHPMGRELAMLRVGIQARERSPFVKLPANLVFLVDVSGSMRARDKLPLVKLLLSEALDALEPDDLVSIVTYSGSTRVALEPTPAREADRIRSVIDGLRAAGTTAGGAGLQLAYEQAEAGFREGGINHVVLCTDGDFNVGISRTEDLVAFIEEKRESGVTLTALGFGRGNLNDEMMELVSNAGNGIYSVITSEEQARRYAREELLRTAEHVAKDVKIQVEFNPEHVVAYRLLGYENRALDDEDFRVDTVDAGEIGAGHHVMALYEVVLVGQEIPMPEGAPMVRTGEPSTLPAEIDPADLVLVKVRYKRPGAAAEDPALEVASSLPPEALAPSLDEADADLLWASAVAALAELMRGSPFAQEADLDAIEAIAATQAGRDADRATFLRIVRAARPLIEARP